jgi:hypothetical protein
MILGYYPYIFRRMEKYIVCMTNEPTWYPINYIDEIIDQDG